MYGRNFTECSELLPATSVNISPLSFNLCLVYTYLQLLSSLFKPSIFLSLLIRFLLGSHLTFTYSNVYLINEQQNLTLNGPQVLEKSRFYQAGQKLTEEIY